MDTNVEALKKLYVALGGTAADVANVTLISEMIVAISVVAADLVTAATTKELPEVSSANNGQVLTVDDGKWGAKALPE